MPSPRTRLPQVVLFLVFALWLPWVKGTSFLDSTILGAYACLGVVFAAPQAASGISVFKSVRNGLLLSWAMLASGVAVIYFTRRVVVGPDLLTLAEIGLFGLTLSLAASAAVAFTAARVSESAAKVVARLLLLVLLGLFYLRSGWLPDVALTGAVLCSGIAAVFLFLLRVRRVSDGAKPDRFDILLRVGGFAVVAFAVLVLASSAMARFDPVVRSAFAVFIAGLMANFLLAYKFERGRLEDFGLGRNARSVREFSGGFAIGAGAVSLLIGGADFAGLATFERTQADWSVLWLAAVLLAGAIGEELVFRGYAFQYLGRCWGQPLTILLSAVLFGLAHLSNQNVQVLGAVNTMIWGGLLGYAFTRAGTLWLSSGLHYGWNLALVLLTSNLSGITIRATAWDLRWSAGELWSGGGYGLEGGLLAAIVAVPVFLFLRRVR